jgi:hypothetical protein
VIKAIYRRLPGPSAARVAIMLVTAYLLLVVVIWSYELLGDLLDTGGAVGE